MDVFKRNYNKLADNEYLYLKYFVDLEGNPIYARRKEDAKRDEKKERKYWELKEGDYQDHDDLALWILEHNQNLEGIWKKLTKEFPSWIADPRSFLICFGYVLVDGLDNTHDYIQYDSVTTPKIVLEMMDQDDPFGITFDRDDVAERHATWTMQDCEELDILHERILEEKKKLEQSRKTTYHGNDDER